MMMAVVITFENDSDAIDYALSNPNTTGIYKIPTMFCDGQHGGRKTEVGFTKGLKYGWWVCAKCMKPKRQYWDNIWKDPGIGYNLLTQFKIETST